MRKFYIAMIMCFFALTGNAQKIKVNKVDKFTKEEVIQTSRETLYTVNFMGGMANTQYQFAFCINRNNGKYTMPAYIVLENCEKYDDKSCVTFLLENGDTVTLYTAFTGISSPASKYGWGFETCFDLSDDEVRKLKSSPITDVRISYMGGQYDRALKANKMEVVKKSLELFDNL